MKKYSEFHDGLLDGVFVDGSSAYVFLSTFKGEHFVFEATDVVALHMEDFRQGNVIFEVLVRNADELTLEDIEQVKGGFPEISRERYATRGLEVALERKPSLLEIYPSYGATCLVLAGFLDLHLRLEKGTIPLLKER